MAESVKDNTFLDNKYQFFSELREKELITRTDDGSIVDLPLTEENIACLDTISGKVSYQFLLKNQISLETEFLQQFDILKKNKDKKDKNDLAFWMYCYYCSSLLETFYKSYVQPTKEKQFAELRAAIKARLLQKENNQAVSEEQFIQSMKKSFLDGFYEFIKFPTRISQIRDYVALTNLYRLYWVFCRLTLTSGLALARDLQFLDKLDAVLGTHTDVDKIASVLQAPNGVLIYFSVGLFLARFIIDAGLLLKHTFAPTDPTQSTRMQRFKYELYKRQGNFANDLVWGTVNFLTNFNFISHIPGPVTGIITAAFLGFDVCLLLYRLTLAKQEYMDKRKQYDAEIKRYNDPKQCNDMCDKERIEHLAMLAKQMKELEINWETKEATFYFLASAAALLMIGFTAAILFTPPGIAVASFFACTLAAAMYFSAGSYTNYKEKSLRLERADKEDQAVARKEYETARNNFIFTLLKNAIVPTVLITTFAICWPAAIALTVVYLGYEIFHAYNQHQSKKEANNLALFPPQKREDSVKENNTCFAFCSI